MFFIDSWVWIDFFAEGEKHNESRKVLDDIIRSKAIINPIVLCEVRYRLSKKVGIEKAQDIIDLIEQIPNLYIVPVNSEIGKYAADLRLKYYQPKIREMSYSDALNLATAIKTGCKTLYSGDPDFQNIKEIQTIIIK